MCEPTTIAIGAAIGAATSAATGNDPLVGAVIGGASAGFGGFGADSFSASLGTKIGLSSSSSFAPSLTTAFSNIGASTITQAGVGGFALAGLGAGVASNVLFPKAPEYSTSNYGYSPIQYNAQQNTVTGSGGAQASALLASEIQRVQKNRQGVTNTSALNTQPFQTTGLQLA